jgi:hypothetical protein
MGEKLRNTESMHREQLKRRMRLVATSLHHLAVAADRAVADVVEVNDGDAYARIVGDLQHEVLWGLANLNLDSLVGSACGADVARAVAKSSTSDGE